MSAEAFRLLRAIMPEGRQRSIHRGRCPSANLPPSRLTRPVRNQHQGPWKKLKINYRTTDEIRRFAVVSWRAGKLTIWTVGLISRKATCLYPWEIPMVRAFEALPKRSHFSSSTLQDLLEGGLLHWNRCALSARTKHLLESYISQLQAGDLATYEIKRNTAEQREKPWPSACHHAPR